MAIKSEIDEKEIKSEILDGLEKINKDYFDYWFRNTHKYASDLAEFLKCPLLYKSGMLLEFLHNNPTINSLDEISMLLEKEAYLQGILSELTSRILDLELSGVRLGDIYNQAKNYQPVNPRDVLSGTVGANEISIQIDRKVKLGELKKIIDELDEKGYKSDKMFIFADKMIGEEIEECVERLYQEGLARNNVTETYFESSIKQSIKSAIIEILRRNRKLKAKDITYDMINQVHNDIEEYFKPSGWIMD